jgi:hypothetical protein
LRSIAAALIHLAALTLAVLSLSAMTLAAMATLATIVLRRTALARRETARSGVRPRRCALEPGRIGGTLGHVELVLEGQHGLLCDSGRVLTVAVLGRTGAARERVARTRSVNVRRTTVLLRPTTLLRSTALL